MIKYMISILLLIAMAPIASAMAPTASASKGDCLINFNPKDNLKEEAQKDKREISVVPTGAKPMIPVEIYSKALRNLGIFLLQDLNHSVNTKRIRKEIQKIFPDAGKYSVPSRKIPEKFGMSWQEIREAHALYQQPI